MSNDELTFGKEIARLRKEQNLSQKALAKKVLKEDNTPITPQYLNDIEHDRRNPTSDELIKSFSRALNLSQDAEDYLFFVAGKLPQYVRNISKDEFLDVVCVFRKQKKD